MGRGVDSRPYILLQGLSVLPKGNLLAFMAAIQVCQNTLAKIYLIYLKEFQWQVFRLCFHLVSLIDQ